MRYELNGTVSIHKTRILFVTFYFWPLSHPDAWFFEAPIARIVATDFTLLYNNPTPVFLKMIAIIQWYITYAFCLVKMRIINLNVFSFFCIILLNDIFIQADIKQISIITAGNPVFESTAFNQLHEFFVCG